MRKLNNFINERLSLNNQSKLNNEKNFSNLKKDDIIYKMILHDKYFTNIDKCIITSIINDDEYVNVNYVYQNDKIDYATFSADLFYDDVFNNIMIDSMYTNIYYFINKNDAKKLQSSHISKSIKKLQDDLSALKDINNPNYKKDIKDRDHIIKELEKELNELIGRLHNYN